MASSMINVMLVDDHAVVRAGYHRFAGKACRYPHRRGG